MINRILLWIVLPVLSLSACQSRDYHRAELLLEECYRFYPERQDYYFEYSFSNDLDSERRQKSDTLRKRLRAIQTMYPTTAAGRFAAFWERSIDYSLKDKSYDSDSMKFVLMDFIHTFPDSYHPYLATAWYALDSSTNFSEVVPAWEYIQKAISKAPKSVVLHTWASHVEFRKDPTNLNRNSMAVIRKAVEELDSNYYLANSEYFKLLTATEDSIKGSEAMKEKILKRCIRIDPDCSFGYTKLAEISSNHYEKMANLDSAIRLNDKRAFGLKAQILFNKNFYDEVVKFLDSAPRHMVDTATFIKKAYSEYFTGRKEEAERTLEAYSASGRTDGEFHRAHMEMSEKNFESALTFARKQLAKDDSTFIVSHHVLLINLLVVTGRRAEAREHFAQYEENISTDAPQGTPSDYGINDLMNYTFLKQ